MRLSQNQCTTEEMQDWERQPNNNKSSKQVKTSQTEPPDEMIISFRCVILLCHTEESI